jgi:hypothetical protein
MKSIIIKTGFFAFLFAIAFSFSGCEEKEKEETLYVKFCNESASHFAITSIEVRPRGKVGEDQTPTNNWGSNLLTGGAKIEPGGHVFFTLAIPSLHWSEYRLKVDMGDGEIVAVEYDGLPITHWGGDDRTVGVTVVLHEPTNKPIVLGWSDNAGI